LAREIMVTVKVDFSRGSSQQGKALLAYVAWVKAVRSEGRRRRYLGYLKLGQRVIVLFTIVVPNGLVVPRHV
jgi:hypothetical protein